MSGAPDELFDEAEKTIERPADRYGNRRVSLTTQRIIIVVFIVLLVGGTYLAWKRNARPNVTDVQGYEAGFTVVDDAWIDLHLDVTRDDPGRPAYCIVKALDYGKNEVGRREVHVPPAVDDTVTVTVPIHTSRRAVAATVFGCGTNMPAHLTGEI